MKALLVTALVILAASPSAALAGPKNVELTFDKTAVAPGTWQGTVAGDVTGGLTTNLTALRIDGPIWHVSFNWHVFAGSESFVASLNGTLDTRTGAVAMKGRVTEGWLLGARVKERGQLVDPAISRFTGSITIKRPKGR